MRRRLAVSDLLDDRFALLLHKQILGDVWTRAGAYRLTERNIGIEAYRIPVDVRGMFDDVRYWVEYKTQSPDEIAVRLHHRLAAIHPFPNGNGRHARLMADLLVERLGEKPFSWGGGGLTDTGTLRASYVAALQAADCHDVGPLLAFART